MTWSLQRPPHTFSETYLARVSNASSLYIQEESLLPDPCSVMPLLSGWEGLHSLTGSQGAHPTMNSLLDIESRQGP